MRCAPPARPRWPPAPGGSRSVWRVASTPEPRTGSAHRVGADTGRASGQPSGQSRCRGRLRPVPARGRCRPDLHAQFAEGVDRGWSHRRHRPERPEIRGRNVRQRPSASSLGVRPNNPASAARNAPVHTVTTRRAVPETALTQSMRAGSDRAASTPAPPGRITVSTGSPGNPTITTLRAMNASVGQALAWRPRHTPHRLGHAGGAALPERPCTGLGRLCPWHR